jgi:hypothetical protein
MSCEVAVDSAQGQGTTPWFELGGALAKGLRERPVSHELVAFPAS